MHDTIIASTLKLKCFVEGFKYCIQNFPIFKLTAILLATYILNCILEFLHIRNSYIQQRTKFPKPYIRSCFSVFIWVLSSTCTPIVEETIEEVFFSSSLTTLGKFSITFNNFNISNRSWIREQIWNSILGHCHSQTDHLQDQHLMSDLSFEYSLGKHQIHTSGVQVGIKLLKG